MQQQAFNNNNGRNGIEDKSHAVSILVQPMSVSSSSTSPVGLTTDDCTDSSLPSGRVTQIRRQWALHEDEALAYRLQTEEITQHYSGNRSRNAIVREDGPKAREEQKKEEQEALELRFQQLNLLQQQAEEDSRYAKLLAEKEEKKLKTNNRLQGNSGTTFHQQKDEEDFIGAAADLSSVTELDFDILDKLEKLDFNVSNNKSTMSSSSSSGVSTNEAIASTSAACSKQKLGTFDIPFELEDEDELRYSQQENDEALARKLQEEIEQLELDRKLALEAQDRELAKMLYEKEKAKLKRAKERSKLRATEKSKETYISSSNSTQATQPREPDNQKRSPDSRSQSVKSPTPSSSSKTHSISSRGGIGHSHKSPTSSISSSHDKDDSNFNLIPPKIPEKSSKSSSVGGKDNLLNPIDFRANPKPLPPQPESQQQQACINNNRSELTRELEQPIPPYMPMQGFNNRLSSSSKKK